VSTLEKQSLRRFIFLNWGIIFTAIPQFRHFGDCPAVINQGWPWTAETTQGRVETTRSSVKKLNTAALSKQDATWMCSAQDTNG
jgi:hypothetical protein